MHVFAPAQLLRNWREQWPSNKGDLDSSLKLGESITRGGPASYYICVWVVPDYGWVTFQTVRPVLLTHYVNKSVFEKHG
jgi:hypothetical protein